MMVDSICSQIDFNNAQSPCQSETTHKRRPQMQEYVRAKTASEHVLKAMRRTPCIHSRIPVQARNMRQTL